MLVTYEACLLGESCGKKAENLAVLRNLGMRVPKGIIIPPSTLAPCLSALEQLPKGVAYFINSVNLEPLMLEIQETLGVDDLIIRSSSQFEDTPDTPGYGVYHSERCLITELVPAIWRCLAWTFSDSVVAYKQKMGLPQKEHLALIVQEYIDGDVSGVVLSVDVAKKDPDVMVAELIYGPCSAVTSGLLNPSCFRMSRRSGEVEHERGSDVFSHSVIKNIFCHTELISNELGMPVDVEFTMKEGQLVILQARGLPKSLRNSGSHGEL